MGREFGVDRKLMCSEFDGCKDNSTEYDISYFLSIVYFTKHLLVINLKLTIWIFLMHIVSLIVEFEVLTRVT